MSMSKDEIWWDTLHHLMDDYENNPEALTTHIKNRVSEDYAALEQERDGLKAMVEELRGAYEFLTQGFDNQVFLDKTPAQCLAEVEARAVEKFARSYLTSTVHSLTSFAVKYAQKLREKAK